MGAGGLRRKTSYLFGVFLLVAGGLAGATLADGAPAVGLPTTALPTIGITTSITVPSATVTVPTPTITVPTPTVSVTVPTPTVTTPVTTVSLPPVTTAVVATVPAPTVAATVSTPPVTVKTPAVTVAASVASQPTRAAGVTVASAPARVGVAATGAVVRARVATGARGVGTQTTRSKTFGAAATLGTGGTAVATGSATATIPAATAVGGAGSIGSGPLAQALPAALSATSRAAPTPGAGPVPTETGRPPARPSESAATVLLSPLASDLTAGPAPDGSVQQAQVRPNSRPSSGWSSTDTRRTAVGGLAALLALGAIGLAAAARSSAAVAVCAELSRFPFPRFRILPCPGVGHVARSGLDAGPAAAPTSGHTGAATSSPGATAPRRPRGSRFPLPRIGGVLGTAFSKPHPWEILRAVALGLLAFANAVLLAIRWRIGRLHVP